MKKKMNRGLALIIVLLVLLSSVVQASELPGVQTELVRENFSITEPETNTDTEPESESEKITEPVTEPMTEDTEKPFITIDNKHVYKNMDKSYEEGYTPLVEKDSALLVVPFLVKGKVKQEEIYAKVNLGDAANAPFVFQNYNRTIYKKAFSFQEESVDAYLLALELELKENPSAGAYPVVIQLDGHSASGEVISQEYTFYVTIEGEELPKDTETNPTEEIGSQEMDPNAGGQGSEGSSGASEPQTEKPLTQPKVILISTNLPDEPLKAGESTDIKVKFQNTNRDTYIQNIKILLTTEGNTMQFDKRSFYVEKVASKEAFEINFKATVLKDTLETKLKLAFAISYENKKAVAVTDTEELLLQVTQPMDIEMENLGLPAEVYAAETIPVTLKVMNLSRGKIYNVRYTLEAGGLFPKESAFIGNMDAGTSQVGSATVFIGTKDMRSIEDEGTGTTDQEKYGKTSGVLTLTYEDEFGTTYKKTHEFTTKINKPEMVTPVIPKQEKETASQWWISLLAAGGGIFLVLAVIGIKKLFLKAGKSDL